MALSEQDLQTLRIMAERMFDADAPADCVLRVEARGESLINLTWAWLDPWQQSRFGTIDISIGPYGMCPNLCDEVCRQAAAFGGQAALLKRLSLEQYHFPEYRRNYMVRLAEESMKANA